MKLVSATNRATRPHARNGGLADTTLTKSGKRTIEMGPEPCKTRERTDSPVRKKQKNLTNLTNIPAVPAQNMLVNQTNLTNLTNISLPPLPTRLLHFGAGRLIQSPMWTVAALYRFVDLTNLPKLQAELKRVAESNDICGTILIAPEGINGTIAGVGDKLDAMIDALDQHTGIKSGELKYSTSTGKPFLRMKVRMKKEIITMAAREANPTKIVGQYVEPADWNALIADPDVTLIDTRNDYETAVGIFRGAIDPNIQKFTDFKKFVAENMDPAKQKKVAMFCTGGIRCEKASAYMLAHGFEEVYHLKGGILKYLETIPADQSQWDGECFVFDRRVAVGHGLTEGIHDICYGCRFPLEPGDKDTPLYEEGVSCPRCHAGLTKEKAASLRMRHTQFTKNESTI